MARLNLTLDPDTYSWLCRHADRDGAMRAKLARDLLREGIAQREQLARRRKLAADYAADRPDAANLLAELEPAELELLGDDDLA